MVWSQRLTFYFAPYLDICLDLSSLLICLYNNVVHPLILVLIKLCADCATGYMVACVLRSEWEAYCIMFFFLFLMLIGWILKNRFLLYIEGWNDYLRSTKFHLKLTN